MTQISFTFNKIVLRTSDPRYWEPIKRLTGKVEETSPGTFEMALSTHNLQRIARLFGGSLPQVSGGHRFLEEIKAKLRRYKEHKLKVQEVLSKERYPVEPNGKFIPYAHQTKIIGTILYNPLSPIFADCGLGKTGSVGRAVELCIESGDIQKGKVLVSAPLSILHTSWGDDLAKFTTLSYSILWTPEPNKTILSKERVTLGNKGEKPKGAFAIKKKTGTLYRHPSGDLREVITVLDGSGWVKLRASWKVAVMPDGSEIPFGEVYGRAQETEKTREQYIRDQLNRSDVDVFLINHDGVRIYEDILKDHNFEWVIVDESTKIKSPRSKVSHAHVQISWKCKRRNILSGTPNPNGFTDLWQQFYFLDRGLTLEPCLKDYLEQYFKPLVVGFVRTPGGKKEAVKYVLKGDEQKEALIRRVRETGIYLEQRDCIDLPARTDMKRIVYMSKEQEQAYDRMALDLVAELTNSKTGKSTRADAVNVLSKIMKLRQITSGFLMNKEGEVVHLSNNPKWEDLDEFIEELGSKKIVIASQFREEITQLVGRYDQYGARAIYGDIAVEERARIIRDFQSSEECKVIVIQPAAAAHGITLTASSHLLFTSLDYNFEYYYQTAKRIERLGQKNPIFIIHSLARYQDGSETIDEELLDVLDSKKGDRDSLFLNKNQQQLDEIAERLTSNLIKQVEQRHGKK